MIKIKEQMLSLGGHENPFFVPLYLAMLREGCRTLRDGLEQQLREGKLGKRMSPEKSQQAIYGLQMFEDSLRVH